VSDEAQKLAEERIQSHNEKHVFLNNYSPFIEKFILPLNHNELHKTL
jgi:hypothetical protein